MKIAGRIKGVDFMFLPDGNLLLCYLNGWVLGQLTVWLFCCGAVNSISNCKL